MELQSENVTATSRRPRFQLDGVPILAPIIFSIAVLITGAVGEIPVNMIGGLAVIVSLGMLLGPLGNWSANYQ
ncbi:hypothetical protein AAHB37_18875 [Glutamicibacter halophytocola]|uniref:hypothetical protein n=1 Tax=Glutamicibacter halophytocola TaxID=1933880 RepID=UPI00321BFC6E